MSRTFKIAISAIATIALFAPVALAQTGPTDSSMRVAYGDLDMSQPTSGDFLLKRIDVAARKVCDDAALRSPLRPRAVAICQNETVANTVRGLNIGALTIAWNSSRPVSVQLSAR